ncbi:MAG: 8-oxoguanine DNA glycosylase [Clostridiales bacterium]|nr:8-oxoguanine DNA glycosylase [Clostridiales bacterium]
MKQIVFNNEFFNIKDTLECGQIFRFTPFENGYLVYSMDKCAYAYSKDNNTVIECEEVDEEYFYNFFDLARDYKTIYNAAKSNGVKILSDACEQGKGIRILKQNALEMLFSFLISQNNNIPRIKGSIDKLCASLGEKKTFNGKVYFTFPSVSKMAEQSVEFYRQIGLGYRAEYILSLAKTIKCGLDINSYNKLSTVELKKELIKLYGVGPKVADCVLLFGFNRTDSFPVDTWIDKVYIEDFNGTEKSREKVSKWFVGKFKDNSGYFQQYLFHYKRNLLIKKDKIQDK